MTPSYLAPFSCTATGLKKNSVRRSIAADRLPRLTAQQRCVVAQSELEEYKKDIERLELEGRMSLSQEKDAQLENLRIENDSLHRDYRRFDKYLRESDECGESLDAIELEHMKIRCQQLTHEVRRLEAIGLEVKATLIRASQTLATQKHQLKQEMDKNRKLYAQLNQIENMNLRLEAEIKKNEQHWNEDQLDRDTLKRVLLTYKVPDTQAYIQSVTGTLKLTRQKALLDRKKCAAQLTLLLIELTQPLLSILIVSEIFSP
ncbi:uncharacterized protein DEA37_0012032, partial [Paragonimus westermani]